MKTMIYTTEDGRCGIKDVKFNFQEGLKIYSRESGKVMICKGVYEFGYYGRIMLKFLFGKVKNNSDYSLEEKVDALKDAGIVWGDEKGEGIAEVKYNEVFGEPSEKLSQQLEDLCAMYL